MKDPKIVEKQDKLLELVKSFCQDKKNSQPYSTVHDICGFFGTAQSTTSQKSKAIRDLLKLSYFDSEFSTASLQESSPFNNLVSINGFIVPRGTID